MVIKVTFCEVNNYYHQLQEGCVKTHITPTMALRDMASQRVAEQLQDEGGEQGGEEAVDGESERRECAVAIAGFHGYRRAHGVGGRAHRKSLGNGAIDARQLHHPETCHAAEYAGTHHDGGSERRNAAYGLRHLDGDRGGDRL